MMYLLTILKYCRMCDVMINIFKYMTIGILLILIFIKRTT